MAYPQSDRLFNLTDLAGGQAPGDLAYFLDISGGTAAGDQSDRKMTLNDLFDEITKNVTNKSIQWADGDAPGTLSAAGKGRLRYSTTAVAAAGSFQVSENAAAFQNLIKGPPSAGNLTVTGSNNFIPMATVGDTIGDSIVVQQALGGANNNAISIDHIVAGESLAAFTLSRLMVVSNVTNSIKSLGLYGSAGINSIFFSGTPTAPNAVTQDTEIFRGRFGGQYDTTAGHVYNGVYQSVYATENWGASNQGAGWVLQSQVDAASPTNLLPRILVNQLGAVIISPGGSAVAGARTTSAGSNILFAVGTAGATADNNAVAFFGHTTNVGSTTLKNIVAQQKASQTGALIETQSATGVVQFGVYPMSGVANHFINWVGSVNTPAVSAAGSARMYVNSSGAFQVSENGGAFVGLTTGGSGTPAGSNTQVQFNSSSAFGASASLTFTTGTGSFSIGQSSVQTGVLTLRSGGGATLANFKVGDSPAPTSTSTFIWPIDDPAAGEFLKVTSYSSSVCVLEWAAGGGGSSPPFDDGTALVKGSGDATKLLRIEADGISTATTRVWTAANADIVVAGSASALTSGRVPFVTTTGLLLDDTAFLWDNTNKRLGIGAGITPGAPVDILANVSAIAEQWREPGGGSCRVQMQMPTSFGLVGTSSNHDFGFITNNVQVVNIEKTGAACFGVQAAATGQVLINAQATGTVGLVVNNFNATSVDIAKFQNNSSNRVVIGNSGTITAGLASTATGKLTLFNSAGTTSTTLQSGNAATTLAFTWPIADPTAGQILSASAPSSGVVTLSWVASSGSGTITSSSADQIPVFTAATTIAGATDFTFTHSTSAKTLTITSASSTALVRLTPSATGNSGFSITTSAHPGTGSGIFLAFTAGSVSDGPGIWWTNGTYSGLASFYIAGGFNLQGWNSSNSSLKIHKGTGTSSDGTTMFQFDPDTPAMTLGEAVDIVVGTTTGTKIGTGTTQKISFWNSTPVVQQSSTGETVGFTAGGGTTVTDSSTFTGNVGATAYRISDIVKHLKTIGLIAS